jgi:hypothetical protein
VLHFAARARVFLPRLRRGASSATASIDITESFGARARRIPAPRSEQLVSPPPPLQLMSLPPPLLSQLASLLPPLLSQPLEPDESPLHVSALPSLALPSQLPTSPLVSELPSHPPPLLSTAVSLVPEQLQLVVSMVTLGST